METMIPQRLPPRGAPLPHLFLELLKGESGRMGGMKDKTGEECVAGTRGHDLFIRTELLGQRKPNNVLRFRVRSPLRH